MVLDPYIIGGRFAIFAAQYQQYRIKSGFVKYRPDCSPNGLVDMAGGPSSATVTYENRAFALGIFKDPALSSITYENILQTGGFYGSTTKGFTLRVPSSGWLWTSTTASSPTTIDLRMTSFGKMFFAYFIASTTATASYGHLEFSLVIEFKGTIDNAALLGKVISREIARPRSIYITDVDSKSDFPMNLKDDTIVGLNQTPMVVNDDDFSDIMEEKEEKGGQQGKVVDVLETPKVLTVPTQNGYFAGKKGSEFVSVTKGETLSTTPSLLEVIKLQERIQNLMDVIDGMKSSSCKGSQ
jgi:hypothetical protein